MVGVRATAQTRCRHLAALTLTACAASPASKSPWVYPSAVAQHPAQSRHTNAPSEDSSHKPHPTPITSPQGTSWPESSTIPHAPRATLTAKTRTLFFRWPLPATGVNSLFGPRADPVDGLARFHHGIDLEAPYGAIVVAAEAGVVASATWHGGHGRRVIIDHGWGYQTVYSHLAQLITQQGALVRAGEPVGLAGNSGRSTGPHLHFEVRDQGQCADPLEYLGTTVSLKRGVNFVP